MYSAVQKTSSMGNDLAVPGIDHSESGPVVHHCIAPCPVWIRVGIPKRLLGFSEDAGVVVESI